MTTLEDLSTRSNAFDADADAPAGVDPADMAVFVRVAREVAHLPSDHPDQIEARRATAGLYKLAKKVRRDERRRDLQDHDRAVIHSTATGSPGRIDDETAGLLPSSATTPDRVAGTLRKPLPCYVCKELFTQVDWFYHQLCPACAAVNHAKRDARTDLTGRRALLTGGRAKIGMYIALRLLRDGAHLTITTRFPRDAARRFAAMPDAHEWLDRLDVVGIDLRDPAQVVALADHVAARGPLDILVNNAAQTVRRTPGAYSALAEAENLHLPDDPDVPTITFGRTSAAHPAMLAGSVTDLPSNPVGADLASLGPARAALDAASASLERHLAGTAIDAGGLLPDEVDHNSWVATVEQVDPMELLEVQLCNSTAPFILLSRLRASMSATATGRAYVVNVSAMEGVFARGYKGPGHPHTNMAKAAVNMLTRTSATELAEHGIYMTSVDTGWITDERPHTTKVRLAQEGFHAPLDLVDGAARVYDPIVRGEAGELLHGCFLKDYARAPW
ncbi:SDR family oxidoreductase [Miniimonas sp. S16]|uniref:SDR family NAD(P)-dependent oxidoreductase n=1 Tax=Miniimonas sp. S16 TaxID=2171623 RepID=UPI000D529797